MDKAVITERQMNTIQNNLGEACTLMRAIGMLTMRQINDDDDDGCIALSIKAMSEKAGYICDEVVRSLGDPAGIIGNYDVWAGLKPDTDAE